MNREKTNNLSYPDRSPNGTVELLAANGDPDGDEPYRPRIVPIPEGARTMGQSKQETLWERDVLKAATEAGAFDNAKLLRGKEGRNPHKPLTDQADPNDIVGSAGTFRYEEGVGPVSNGDGVLLDEHLATLVDNELVEISPDMLRELGEFDDDAGAYRVAEVLAVPWMTLVDRGASVGAEIGPAEALAAHRVGNRPNEQRETRAETETESTMTRHRTQTQRTAADERAFQILTARDLIQGQKEQLTPAEAPRRYVGVDPANFGDSTEQLAALRHAADEARDRDRGRP